MQPWRSRSGAALAGTTRGSEGPADRPRRGVAHRGAAAARPVGTSLVRRLEPARPAGATGVPVRRLPLGEPAVYTQALFAEGLVRRPIAFATNSLVLIVPRRNPARIAAVGDLAKRPTLRLVVAGPKVPIGLYTREVLKRLGLLRVLRKTVSLEPDVKGIVGKVALGEADAGFVYATDVRPVASKVRVIRFPRRAQPTVVYEAAIAAHPRDLEAAQAFLIALLGADGRRELRAAGFGLPA